MVLRDDIVEVLAAAQLHVLPLWILPPQELVRTVTRYVTVQSYLPRPPGRIGRQCLPEEGLRSGDAPIGSEQQVHGHALLIHGAIKIVPLATNTDVSLVDPPRRAYAARNAMPPLLELGYVPNNSPQNC